MLLQKGSTGSNVTYLQYGLHIMCYSPGGFDGDFVDGTYNAVIKFQAASGLAADGIVGDGTWDKLSSQIVNIQTQLNNKGFNVGVADGFAGPNTYNAVVAFQSANSLTADGQVGPVTWTSLFNSSSSGGGHSLGSFKRVFIDPGHGGSDSGAVGNGLYESNITLSIAQKVGNILNSKGIQVNYSRTTNNFVSLDGRAQQANNWGADLFVSIHCNSHTSSASGTECFTYPNTTSSTKTLSINMANAISSQLGIPNRGHKEADFAVLRLSSMPAILIETAFISNSTDASLLKNSQDKFASVIANQI